MTDQVTYSYASGDLLEHPNTYFYSAYQGAGFVLAWARSRAECLGECENAAADCSSVSDDLKVAISPTEIYLKTLLALFAETVFPVEDRKNLDAILRNFEAKKRIYQDYNPGFTSKDRTDYRELGLYVAFAELMVAAYRRWQEFFYLNALIKCMDILCANRNALRNSERAKMRTLIEVEAECVDMLSHRLGVTS